MKKKLILNLSIFTFVFCYMAVGQDLEVDGIGKFNLNGGSVSMSTPGGWPGIIAIENGTFHRRDITFKTSGIGFLASLTGAPPTNAEGMWISEGGNVGIGTDTPDGKLDVEFGSVGHLVAGTPGGNGPGWIFYNPQNERWDMFASSSSFHIRRNDNSADLQLLESGSLNLNNLNAVVNGDFHVKQKGVVTGSNGMVHQHPTNGNRWNTQIDDANDYNFVYNGTLKSFIRDTDGSYNLFSDRRLKNNIQPITSVLSKINQLNPVTYKYNGLSETTARSWGFIAQEVEEIFPDFVNEKTGFKAIAYDNFVVIAIKAIQEQQAEIENLRKKIEQLENQ